MWWAALIGIGVLVLAGVALLFCTDAGRGCWRRCKECTDCCHSGPRSRGLPSASGDGDGLLVDVRRPGGDTVELRVHRHDTAAELKRLLEEVTGLPRHRQRLLGPGGVELGDAASVNSDMRGEGALQLLELEEFSDASGARGLHAALVAASPHRPAAAAQQRIMSPLRSAKAALPTADNTASELERLRREVALLEAELENARDSAAERLRSSVFEPGEGALLSRSGLLSPTRGKSHLPRSEPDYPAAAPKLQGPAGALPPAPIAAPAAAPAACAGAAPLSPLSPVKLPPPQSVPPPPLPPRP
eukprot:TRINITY_DN65405_c0_g1_i1.p1 TRINITY_DN65405_c0_g1~~TRINITY_DN65405_c0_g1_i1.p1  ORF type:complete len:330 (+),score=104.08 TRINITY_DN65405_c0_g1_i1:87-992(+)